MSSSPHHLLLASRGVRTNGWDTDESQSVQIGLLGGPDDTALWPNTSPHVPFAGSGIWSGLLTKASVFNECPTHKGVHICHALVLFSIDRQPWNMLPTNNASKIISSGSVHGVPTTPRPAGSGGVVSRNPFSSPSRDRKSLASKEFEYRAVVERPIHSNTGTPTRKRKESPPEPIRSKRSTAGKRTARLYH
ncbi:hypothetical protein P885DRAFT_72220 [Corynascus similis CBS 632.67]